ncbi:phage tail tape measure protein [Sphingorhabdus contaminans]|uniref:Phage tail tape measure protein domain-containing protein n=1 Tax=Sphingorhabdus contaminans TaxID=1343899 RepID=A0A553WIT8_9SPHN|nr:phage tail tape measure protein [Sphingorhabdus contaminans]TSB04571.1 hypothetical protein FOM92_03910 [Sphingorhabdus contaminans]
MPELDPLVIKLSVDAKEYNAALRQTERIADQRLSAIEKRGLKMGESMRSSFSLAKGAAAGFVATLGVDAVVQAVKAGLDYASSLGEVAQQLGVTTSALQEYRYAGSQAGLATEEVDMALGQLTRRIGEGVNGTKAQVEAFEKLGISLKDAKGNVIATGDAIPLIADGLQKIKSPAEQSALLLDLFGKSGAKLLPLLSEGSKGVNQLRDAAQKLGLVLSSEQIAKADETADKLDAVRQVLAAKIAGTVSDNAGAILALADALTAVVGAAGKAITGLNEFYKVAANRPGNLFEKVTGTNFSTGAAIRSRDADVGRQEMRANAVRGGGYSPTGRRGGFVAGKNFAGTGLNDILGIGGLGTPGAGTGADIKALGSLIDLFDKPAKQVAKKLDEWAIELDRVSADVAVARAQLTGNPADLLAAEKQRIEANRIAEEANILSDQKNKSIRAQLLKLNDETAQIAVAIAEREATNNAAQIAREAQEKRTRLELDDLADQTELADREAAYADNRKERQRLAEKSLDLQYQIAEKELEAAIAAGEIADADAARARLKRRRLLDEEGLARDNAGPAQSYLADLRKLNFGDKAEEFAVDALKDLNSELARTIAFGGDVGDVLENAFKRLTAQLIETGAQLLLIKPLLESLKEGGGGLGGFISGVGNAIGGLFGAPGRASGGPVSAGQIYRVNEGTRPEFFRPDVAGSIVPLSKMNLTQPSGTQTAQAVALRVELSGDIDARIDSRSAGVAVEVVRAAEPQLTSMAVAETFRRGQRPSLGR